MNDQEKKELLTKDISELESIKAVKLGENKNIIEGNTKLHEVKEIKEKELTKTSNTLEVVEKLLVNKKDEEKVWIERVDKQKEKYAKMVSDCSDKAKELIEINKLTDEANEKKEKAEKGVDTVVNEKFIIGRMKEALTQMFDEMKPVYQKSGTAFPYGSVDEVLDGLINKKDAK